MSMITNEEMIAGNANTDASNHDAYLHATKFEYRLC